MTQVKENARLELMRLLALLHDHGAKQEHWPEWVPLFEGEWDNSEEDMILALKEAVGLGHAESRALHAGDYLDRVHANLSGGREWMMKITPAGYGWIKARDLVGELEQEPVVRYRSEEGV